jgi:hypothetical protein
MQYSLQPQAQYMAIRLTGAPSEPEVRALLGEMLSCYKEKGLSQALIEVKVAFGLDPVAIKSLVSSLPALGFPYGFRMAVLLLDEVAAKAMEFAEDVAVNRGIELRSFRDRGEALAWLSA